MLFVRKFSQLESVLHCALKAQRRVLTLNRSFTRQSRNHPTVKLSWDSLKPDTAFSVDDAVEAAVKAAERGDDADAAAAATEALTVADQQRHLSLSVEDVKFLRSSLSPLGLLGEAESGMPDDTAKLANRPSGCPHWGKVSEPAARPDQAVSAAGESSELNATYTACAQRDWARVFLRPATNPWQELIQQTAEGKLWHYPIDNEQGREQEPEGRLSFQHHVMLERHLNDWVPKSGPVRHFMETVCIGLSKNPYLTAADKADHLDWYKRYFADKLDGIQAAYAQSVGGASANSSLPT